VNVPGLVYKRIAEKTHFVDVKLGWLPNSEDAVVGRFISFLRDHSRVGVRTDSSGALRTPDRSP